MVDETTELMDERIAQHIVDLHRNPQVRAAPGRLDGQGP
jgi:hypothetical protein